MNWAAWVLIGLFALSFVMAIPRVIRKYPEPAEATGGILGVLTLYTGLTLLVLAATVWS